MKSRSKRGVLAGLSAGAGVVVFAGSALAGLVSQTGVAIDDTHRTAEGTMVGARASANNVEYIGVTSDEYGITFWAKNAAGTYRSCYAPSPSTDFRVRMGVINDQSRIKFTWEEHTSYCIANIIITNGSQYTSP